MTPYAAALLAQGAYTSVPNIGAEDSAARVVFADTDDGRAWCIPGTNNFACLLADLDALTFDAGLCGEVHAGIWHPFAALLAAVHYPVYPNVLIGHSEGAAGAIFMAAILVLRGQPPKAVYAFEPPHTSTDAKLRQILTDAGVAVYLTHHGHDGVPMVPLPIPEFDWQHAADVVYFGKPHSILPNLVDHMIAGIIADLTVQ